MAFELPYTISPDTPADAEPVQANFDAIEARLNNIDNDSLATDCVGTEELKVDAVETENIKDLNVTTNKYADLSVTNPKLALSAVETPNIKDKAVTGAKMDDTGWVASAITYVSGWETENAMTTKYRRIGNIVYLYLNVKRSAGASTWAVGTKGDITNCPVALVPEVIKPTMKQGLTNGALGTTASFFIDTNGQIYIAAVDNSYNSTGIAPGTVFSIGGSYVLG